MDKEQNIKNSSLQDDDITVKSIVLFVKNTFFYLLSKWKIIIIAGIVGASVGVAFVWNNKPIYKANFSFVLEDEKGSGGLGGALGLASQFGFDLSGGASGAFAGENLIELMKSRSLVVKALLRPIQVDKKIMSLVEYYLEFSKIRETWKNKPELKGVKFPVDANPHLFSRVQDSVLTNVHNSIVKNVLAVGKVDKKLSILVVEVKSEDEFFSKTFTEALVAEVSKFYVETKTKKSAANVMILQQQTDSVRRVLNQAITSVAKSSDNIPNLNVTRQVLRSPGQQRQVDVQANTAILTELVKNLEISKLSLRNETPLIQVIDKPVLPLPFERTGKLKGLVIGGLLGGVLASLIVFGKKMIEDILI